MWDAEPIIGADILKLFNVAAQAGATGRPLVEEMDTQGAGEAPQMSQDVVEGMALRTRSLQQDKPETRRQSARGARRDACSKPSYSRKDKSLGLLCDRFLDMCEKRTGTFSLDSTAADLGVERRRMYDVVNVLESIGMLVRHGVNVYEWLGQASLDEALKSIVDDPEGDLSPPGTARGGRAAARATDKRKDRSLGVLTRKFVRELLRGGSVSLDAFNEKLERLRLSIDPDASQCKTQGRRLYDIANVLVALKLVDKFQAPGKKPTFRWVGRWPEGMGPSVRQGGRGEAARASRSAASPAASPSANDKTPDAAAVAAAVMVGMGAAGDRSHSVARERLREGLTCHASRGLLSTLVEVERVLQAISAPPGPAPGAPPAASALLHGATLDPIVSAKQRPGGGHAPATSRHPRKRVAAEGPGAVPAAWEGCGTGVGSPGVGMGVGDGLEGTPPTATGSTLRHGWGEGEGRRDGAGKTPATCVVKRARLGDLTGAGVGLGG